MRKTQPYFQPYQRPGGGHVHWRYSLYALLLLLTIGLPKLVLAQCTPSVIYTCQYMYIANVSTTGGVTNLNNTTACSSGGYGNFAAQSASQYQGASLTMSFTSASYVMNYAVWVDLNDNGSFADAGEKLLTISNNNSYTITGNIVIPVSASAGNHVMRVMGDYSGSAQPNNPCGTLEYGETEDYTLTVLALSPCSGAPTAGTVSVAAPTAYCNSAPSKTLTLTGYTTGVAGISFQWQSSTDGVTFSDIAGATGTTYNTPAGTTSTTYYQAVVNCSASGQSAASNVIAINIGTTFTISPTATPGTVCPGSTSQLNAGASTGLTTYSNTVGANAYQDYSGGPFRQGACANYKVQYLYTAAELSAAGINAGQITALTFNGTNAGGGGAMANYTISIKSTATADFTGGNMETGLTPVFGPVAYTSVVGANTFTFSTPFTWDGTSNIVVQVCHDYTCTGSASVEMTNINSRTLENSSGTGCAATNGNIFNNRPVTKFDGTSGTQLTYSWSPAASLNDATSATPVATPSANTTYTLTATEPGGCTQTGSVAVNVTQAAAFSVCPGDQVATGCAGSAPVTYTATADAPITYVFSGATTGSGSGTGSGESFNSGITTVTLTADNGTCTPATCTFTVTAGDIQAPVITACNADVIMDPLACACYPMLATVPTTPTIGFADRAVTYNNVSINGGGNAAQVAPGSTVSISYNMSVAFDFNTGYCPGCVVQSYIGIGGTNTTIQCENSIYDGYTNSHNVTFAAPATPGYYYLTQNGTLDFGCVAGIGFANEPRYAIGVIQVGASYAGLSVAATDNCGIASVTNDAPSCFPAGTTVVTYTVTDNGGNVTTCTQNVTSTGLAVGPVIISNPQDATACEGTSFTLTVAATVATFYQWYHNGSAIVGANSASYTVNAAATADAGTYYAEAIAGSCGTATSTTATVTVNPAPAVAIAPSATTICPGGNVTLTASGADTYEWTPGGSTTNPEVFSPAATTTYTVTGTTTATGCTGTASTTISVSPSINVIPTASPATICAGGSSQLDAGATGGTGSAAGTYLGSAIAYSPVPTPGTGVTTLATGGAPVEPVDGGVFDDAYWDITLPFAFSYYGTSYTTAVLSTNGHVDFGGTSNGTNIPGYSPLPNADFYNSIIPIGVDIYLYDGGTVEYFTAGTAPNRRFVVNYNNVALYDGGSTDATVQMVLNESDNTIEFHTTSFTGNGGDNPAVQGIVDPTGTQAVVVPGRNSVSSFSGTPDGYKFTPVSTLTLLWDNAATLDDATSATPVATPAATTTYTVTATDPISGCSNTGAVTVNVNAAGTWTGVTSSDWSSSSNWCGGVPDATSNVIIPDAITVPNNPVLSAVGNANNINLQTGSVLTVAAGGTLNLYGNISGAGTFTATNGTVDFAGNVNQSILPGFTTANLVISGGSVKTLSGDVTVGSNLTFSNGMIDAAGSVLSLDAGAVITGASPDMYVRTSGAGGGLRRQVAGTAVSFPVGNSAFNPATLTNSGAPDFFTVGVRDQVLTEGTTGGQVSNVTTYVVNRTWDIEEDVAGGSNVTLNLQWNAGEPNATGFDYNNVYISHYTGGAYDTDPAYPNVYAAPTATGYPGPGPYSATRSGIQSFSPFVVGSAGGAAPLPVTLVKLQAENAGTRNKVEWESASEHELSSYIVERSTDGKSFARMDEVSAAGKAQGYITYDNQPAQGLTYYRLKMTDLNGAFVYSQTVKAYMGRDGQVVVTAQPNPVRDVLTVNVFGATDGAVQLTDVSGRVVMSAKVENGQTVINTLGLAAGTYFMKWSNGTATQTIKISKQ